MVRKVFSFVACLAISTSSKNELSTISEIATFYKISKNHLVKVVHRLAQLGFIISIQGKGGGIKLAKHPNEISIGDVVRKTEPHFHIVECFNQEKNQCVITEICRLKGILNQGMEAFFNVLDQYTLENYSTNALTKKINAATLALRTDRMNYPATK